jgi:hypothetical protein
VCAPDGIDPGRAVAGAPASMLIAEMDADLARLVAHVAAFELPRRWKKGRHLVAPADGAPEGGLSVGPITYVVLVDLSCTFQADEPAVKVVVVDALDIAQPSASGHAWE